MKTLTYGTLPSREEFEAAWEAHDPPAHGRFAFYNDPRVGTCELTCSELWAELVNARREWELGGECSECSGPCQEARRSDSIISPDTAGQWCSDVLGVLGFEWV